VGDGGEEPAQKKTPLTRDGLFSQRWGIMAAPAK
jgi:hypothetical protein